MNSTKTHAGHSIVRRVMQLILLAAGGATLCVAANAADMSKKSDIESNYQHERASCMNGTSNEDRATCLKEAGAARDEARRGQLTDDRSAEQQNAVARCNSLPESDRIDCVRRVQGDGTVSGSARDGGIFRETVTTIPAPSPDNTTPDSMPGNMSR